jgi:serine/threonine protein kinase/tetratricopeptide (TPR) repeat protein
VDFGNQDNEKTRHVTVLEPGTVVSHYRILDRIGAGGMGEVYLAEDSLLHRRVALKILSQAFAHTSDLRERFAREAQALAALNHPHIVTIYEVGEYQGRPFFAMEFIKGHSLREIMVEGPLPIERILALGLQICEGLTEAHGQGIMHRDIKPSNIIIDEKNTARIIDFGLARSEAQPDMTQTPTLMGTIAYMSPEQVRGEKSTDASDLFSLGIVLYQMITGKLPFQGSYEALVQYAIVNDAPPPISTLRPETPPLLQKIVERLLEKDSQARYQRAADVMVDLRRLTESELPDQPEPGQLWAWARRWRWTGAALLATLAVAIGWHALFPTPQVQASPKSLAVLPFENLGPSADEYFADGITDAITTNLTRVGNLRVICRASAMPYKKSPKSLKTISSELGAGYLLTGTIIWDKMSKQNTVRINAQLVRADDNSVVWADTYDRILDKIFIVQSDIAGEVSRALKVAVGENTAPAAAAPTVNLEAYDYYLRGNQYFFRSWDHNDIVNATQMYQKAVELDPQFALAYAMLSRGHDSMFWEYYDRTENRKRLAKEAALKALHIRPDLAEGRLALGYYFYHCETDYNRALGQFDSALQNCPNNPDLYNAVAAVQRRQGKLDESCVNFLKALDLNPRSHLLAFDVALTYGLMRRHTEAMAYLDKTISLAPDWAIPYVFKGWCTILCDGDTTKAQQVIASAAGKADLASSKYYWWLARIIESNYQKILDYARPGSDTVEYYLQCARMNRLLGRHQNERSYADSARLLLADRTRQWPDDARYHSQLGLAYAGLGRKTEALAEGEKAVALLPTTRDAFDALFFVVNLTETLVMFGEYDRAVEQLQYMMSIPGFVSPPYLKLDPLWIPLRTHPGFQKLLQQSA